MTTEKQKSGHDRNADKDGRSASMNDEQRQNISDPVGDAESAERTGKDPSSTDHHPEHKHEEESFQKRDLNEDETY